MKLFKKKLCEIGQMRSAFQHISFSLLFMKTFGWYSLNETYDNARNRDNQHTNQHV